MKKTFEKLYNHKELSKQEAKDCLIRIAKGEINPAQVASFTTVFLMRQISMNELLGFREALLELATKVDFNEFDCIDLCGTGGDGKDSFNISTLSAFIVAGAGYKVAKHGNYSASSNCGSSNVLEYFGYKFTTNEQTLKQQLDKANICYMHAPLFHPSLKNVATIRKELATKTFFNILGPIVNPAQINNQLVGVFNHQTADIYSVVLKDFLKNYSIVHSLDGYDEISLTSDFRLVNTKGNNLLKSTDLGFKSYAQEDILGGKNIKETAKIFENTILGKGTQAQSDVVLANATMAINTINPTLNFEQAKEQASDSLFGLKAYESLKAIVK